MAYQSSYLTDEEKKKQQAEGAGVKTSGVVDSTASTNATGGTAGSAEQPPKQAGTGFVNLAQYLDVNKGVGANLAAKATQDVSSAADTYQKAAQQKVTEAGNKFNEASGTKTAEQLKTGITQDADAYRDQAKDFLGAGYRGPQAQDYTAGLAADKNKITGDLAKVGDQSFQQSQLEKQFGKTGNYTQGFGLLDTFLMRGDESGRKAIDQVKSKATAVNDAFSTAEANIKERERLAKEQLDANKKAIRDTALNQKEAIEKEATPKVAELNRQFQGNEGFREASIADALEQEKLNDLIALSEIANVDANYLNTFNQGNKKAPPPPPNARDLIEWEGRAPGGVLDAINREPSPEERAAAEARAAADRKAVEDAGMLGNAPGTLQIDPGSWGGEPAAPPRPAPPPLRTSPKKTDDKKKKKDGR